MKRENWVFIGNWKKIPNELSKPSSIAIGNFDGVHLGHQKVIKKMLEEAQKDQLLPIALTFNPHPLKVLKPQEAPPLITSLEEKIRILKLLGVKNIIVLDFEEALFNLSPEEFVKEILLGKLKAKFVVVGENFRFGKNRVGDVNALCELGEKWGFRAFIQPSVILEGMPVSSTRIRRIIREGNMKEAWKLLGRPFKIVGKVIYGRKRGKRLGFPTANINPETELIPRRGVYAVFVEAEESLFRGVMNIGFNPTFDDKTLSLEVHILNFNRDIYGERLGIYFIERLRDEKRFANIEELKKAIKRDLECAESILEWDVLSLFYSYFSV